MTLSIDALIRGRFVGKRTAILGFGREGQAAYLLLRRVMPDLPMTILDGNESVGSNPLLSGDLLVKFISGEGYLTAMERFDMIIRSPGIPVWEYIEGSAGGRSPFTLPRGRFTSQTGLFLEQYHGNTVGVTGTKGKSTTSALLFHMLQTAGRPSCLAGNIGNPLFHVAGQVDAGATAVAELSSHQLELITRGPRVAVFLNLFQEHLDAYSSYEAYQEAKTEITRCQEPGEFLVYNADDPLVAARVAPYLRERTGYGFSLSARPDRGIGISKGNVVFRDGVTEIPVWRIHQDRFLRGEHNLRNIMAATGAAMIMGLEAEAVADAIATFKGLEHRLEYAGEKDGIHFYNDSIATIPEACMEAVRTIPMVDTLIAGGFSRGVDYDELGRFLAASGVKNLLLVGEAGLEIAAAIGRVPGHEKNICCLSRFDESVPLAFRLTRKGYVCLLSPAAASYDEFMNFEERGKRYRELIAKGGEG